MPDFPTIGWKAFPSRSLLAHCNYEAVYFYLVELVLHVSDMNRGDDDECYLGYMDVEDKIYVKVGI